MYYSFFSYQLFCSFDRSLYCRNLAGKEHVRFTAHTLGDTKLDQINDSCLSCLICCLDDRCCIIGLKNSQGTDLLDLCGSVDCRENGLMWIAQYKTVNTFVLVCCYSCVYSSFYCA